jgi:hypothetical protein
MFAPSRAGDKGVLAKALADALADQHIAATPSPKQKIEERPNVIEIMLGSKPIK